MKTLELVNATKSLADYAREMGDETVVVTKDGKPLAALVSLENVDRETLSLSTNRAFLDSDRALARRAQIEGWHLERGNAAPVQVNVLEPCNLSLERRPVPDIASPTPYLCADRGGVQAIVISVPPSIVP